MAQFGRPIADLFNGDLWIEDGTGDDTFLFNDIDEASADDADFIRSPVTPTNDVYVCTLGVLIDPLSSTGHTIRVRNSADQDAQETIDFLFELRQGYVNEASQGTLIASTTRNGVTSTAWTTTSYTLSAAEADAITNYALLAIRIRANKV